MLKNQYLKGFHKLFGRARKSSSHYLKQQVDQIRLRAPGQLSLLFSDIIEPEKIKGKQNSRYRVFSADVTFWAMLGQVFRGGSLREAVREVQASRSLDCDMNAGLKNRTGSYSDARKRLSQESLNLVHHRVSQKMPYNESLLQGKRIMLVDSTGIQLEDTKNNQDSYPQPSIQKEGCGFPVIQLTGLFNLANGSLEHYCSSPLDADEGGMFDVELADKLNSGDLLVSDLGFCCYYRVAQLAQRGVDTLMRLYHARKWPEGVKGDDVIVQWKRPCPSNAPDHISEDEWEQMPKTINLRYIRHRIKRKGFRDQEIVLVTTLMKTEVAKLVAIYARRWDIELCFDDIKTSMAMDFVRAKSPEMALKMISVYIIAYNLIRLMILRSAKQSGSRYHRISFKGSLDAVLRFCSQMQNLSSKKMNQVMSKLCEVIGQDIVPFRPYRIDPRVRKRRPKSFPLMSKPRPILKAQILAAQQA